MKTRREKPVEFVPRSHREQIEARNRLLVARLGFVLGLFGGAAVLAVWWWRSW